MNPRIRGLVSLVALIVAMSALAGCDSIARLIGDRDPMTGCFDAEGMPCPDPVGNGVSFFLTDGRVLSGGSDIDSTLLTGSSITVADGAVEGSTSARDGTIQGQNDPRFWTDTWDGELVIASGGFEPATSILTGSFTSKRKYSHEARPGQSAYWKDLWSIQYDSISGSFRATIPVPAPGGPGRSGVKGTLPTVDVVFEGQNAWSVESHGASGPEAPQSGTSPYAATVRYVLTEYRETP